MCSTGLKLALLLAITGAAHAQAPVITKSGDPSVNGDTLYRLASTIDADRTHHATMLFNDAVIRVDANGKGTRTVRQIVYLNDIAGMFRFSRWFHEYEPSFGSIRLNWARVLRPDGTVVESSPYAMKDDLRPRDADRGYEHRGALGLILDEAQPGRIVDVSITEVLDSMPRGMELPRFWAASQPGAVVRRARLVVDASDSLTVSAAPVNFSAVKKEERKGGRSTTTWIATDVPGWTAVEFAPDSDGGAAGVLFHTVASWEQIGAWYVHRARPQFTLGKHGEEKFGQLMRMQRANGADSADTLFRYAVLEMPSLQTSPWLSGFVPWPPDLTITKYVGDSQDKAVLLVALLRRAGFHASYVLVVQGGTRAEASPSPEFLQGAAVLLVRGADSVYIDPVRRWLPMGIVRREYEGALAIVIDGDSTIAMRRIPRSPVGAIVSAHRIEGTMTADRVITWRHVIDLNGAAQEGARYALERERTAKDKEFEVQVDARRDFPGGSGKDLEFSDPRGGARSAQMSFTAVSPAQPASAGSTILPLAFADFTGFVAAAEYLEKHKPRKEPIDVARVVGDSGVTYEARIKIPAGWTAMLPPNIDTTSEFGTVMRHYAQEGNEVRISQKLLGARGVIPPERADALAAWLRAVSAARSPYISIRMKAP